MVKGFSIIVIKLLFIILLLWYCPPINAADPYAVISEKNLFRPDRKEWISETPDPKMVDKKIDVSKLQLYGTIIMGNKKCALIHDQQTKKDDKKTSVANNIYSLGDYIGGYVISAIDEKKVVLDYYGEKATLNLHESKEEGKPSVTPPPPSSSPPAPTPRPVPPKPKEQKVEKKNELQDMVSSGKIPEALAKSPFLSEENMKKILEFNKEIMEEMKASGGSLDQESIKSRVEEFKDKFMNEMGTMKDQ